MKFRHAKISSSPARKKSRKGFALIATLTLMMLLAMLAVTLMAIASTQKRIALQTMLQAEARQQALVGLDAAIGALQVELGADQRVTASSGILNQNEGAQPQHLLGAWNSWDGPIYGKSVSGHGGKISSTYKNGRSSMFRRWLISSRDENATRTLDNAKSLCNRKPGQRVCLVGEGTLGKSLTAQHYVYADLLSMPTLGKNEACFAWWVGGENQKAKVSVQNPEETNDTIEALHRTWDTPAPSFADNADLDFLPETIEQPSRIVTMASLPLLGTTSQAAGMPYFFDVTTTSYSLPVNVSMGGLKQDLCLLLNKPTLKGTEFEARSNQDCPLVENNDVPRGTEPDMPIGSWQNLHAYYNCWPDGSANDGDNFTARLIGSVENAHTRMGGSITNDKLQYLGDPNSRSSVKTVYDTRAMLEQGNSKSGYARTPVMLSYMGNISLRALEEKSGDKEGGAKYNYKLYADIAPFFLWWNPYNVPMRVRSRQLWANNQLYKTLQIQSRISDNGKWSGWQNAPTKGTHYKQDIGQFFQNTENDKTGDIVFQPGEILFFSQVESIEPGGGHEMKQPFAVGYNGNVVSTNTTNTGLFEKKNVERGYSKNVKMEFRVADKTGGNIANHAKPDGYWTSGRCEMAVVSLGYAGAVGNVDAWDVDKDKRGLERHYMLGWYDPADVKDRVGVFCKEADADFADVDVINKAENTDVEDTGAVDPHFVVAIGVMPKTSASPENARLFPGDYRAKIWQHSSPAFWGSAIAEPDDQRRQYHPYQLKAISVGSGANSCPMTSIGRNGTLGVGDTGEEVSFASVLELPVHPPFSLAGFAGMRLQPGWYQTQTSGDFGADVPPFQRRYLYQSGVPGVGIGNAFADPCLPADDVYVFSKSEMEDTNGFRTYKTNTRIFGDYFDHGLLINDAMWDRWFCSSVSDMPDKSGKKQAREVLDKFLKGEEQLPVSRYKRVSTPYNNDALVERIMQSDGWKYIAQYLMIDGGFNVNSTSEAAWAAVLQGLSRRKLVSGQNGRLKFVEDGKGPNQVLFSRFMLSTTDKSIDGLGGYNANHGASDFRDSNMATAWGEVRMLEPEGIKTLARKIVEQVRKRGPFLSMSDFVNRRLEAGENGLTGALQAAIDATDINRDFTNAPDAMLKTVPSGDLYKNPEAAKGCVHTAAPGYLIQSDVLASLGNILTVRDDTFTVRAYGCVRNPNKAVLAQAWCEAVVQRTMQYVDPTNNPEDSDYTPEGKKNGQGLTDTNKVMGRQFRIVSFKWLDNWDI